MGNRQNNNIEYVKTSLMPDLENGNKDKPNDVPIESPKLTKQIIRKKKCYV